MSFTSISRASFPLTDVRLTLIHFLLRLRSLDQDELAVYNAVFAAGRAGLWHRSIQGKSNVLKADVERCIKSLEGKKLIKIVHVKSSKKKMYMLYWLQPSVDVTGGAWFTDGVLDSPFIFALSKFLEMHISKKSWYLSETPQSNKQPSKRLKSNAGEPRLPSQKKYLPYPAGYNGYPTVEQLTPEIEKSGITQTRMDHKSVQELLQVLCFDNKLVQNEDGSYRHLKKPDEVLRAYTRIEKNDVATNFEDFKGELGKNGMTEAPCGQCPVFKLCQPGGAVNPENCEYFGPWLQKALGF